MDQVLGSRPDQPFATSRPPEPATNRQPLPLYLGAFPFLRRRFSVKVGAFGGVEEDWHYTEVCHG